MGPDVMREDIDELVSQLKKKDAPYGVDLLLPKVGGGARKTNKDYTKGVLMELADVMIEKKSQSFCVRGGHRPQKFRRQNSQRRHPLHEYGGSCEARQESPRCRRGHDLRPRRRGRWAHGRHTVFRAHPERGRRLQRQNLSSHGQAGGGSGCWRYLRRQGTRYGTSGRGIWRVGRNSVRGVLGLERKSVPPKAHLQGGLQ